MRMEIAQHSKKMKKTNEQRRFDLIPWDAIRAVAFIQAHGAAKHGPNTWQDVPPEKHLDAALSHLAYWASGTKVDPDTGQSHLWNAATRILYLISQEMNSRR